MTKFVKKPHKTLEDCSIFDFVSFVCYCVLGRFDRIQLFKGTIMPEPRNFGEFFDALLGVVKESGNVEAESFVKRWGDSRTTEWRGILLDEDGVSLFADDMVWKIWVQLVGTRIETLYRISTERGHDLLRQIQEVSNGLGLVMYPLDRPLSPTEFVSTAR